jgi:hypothetical protein
MADRREHLRFAFESRHALGIVRERRRQHLDGDLAMQDGVGRPVDLSHASRADLLSDAIVGEGLANHAADVIRPDELPAARRADV